MKRSRKPQKHVLTLLPLLLLAAALLRFAVFPDAPAISLDEIPEYAGIPYVELDGNLPSFSQEELTADSYETYSPLDALGRSGPAMASVGQDLMPTEERGAIGQVKPSGWQIAKYDCVDGKYLFNRCHLLGYQLTGENANRENLITGTRYLNVEGMLPFENQVADYVRSTGGHVLYRVSPIFQGTELVARGVEMEAQSVEDGGSGVRFHVYVYNVQPGVVIDYATGQSHLEGAAESPEETAFSYVLNTKTRKFHDPGCSGAAAIRDSNRSLFTGDRSELIAQGYTPCGQCQP